MTGESESFALSVDVVTTGEMSESFDLSQGSVVWVADTGLFVACGRQQNTKYTALEQWTRQNDITLVIPQRVYDELGGAPDRSTPGQTPITSAIDDGWVAVADEPDYTNSTVSRVMDDVRGYIARSSDRDEERAEYACILTTDIDAGEGVVAALEANGFEDRVQFKNGFELIEEITA